MFKKIIVNDYCTNIFKDLKEKWALCTAGTIENHNTLTIGWGSIGVLWRKNVFTAYVRGSRHTNDYLINSDYFTISYYDEKYRKDLTMYGTLSGRDVNKDEISGFTPTLFDGQVSYKEANVVIVCKKIYFDVFNKDLFLDDSVVKFYEASKTDETVHYFYIGEIESIFINE